MSKRYENGESIKNTMRKRLLLTTQHTALIYFILCVEFVYFVLWGIIQFDMHPVRDFYLAYKTEIVIVFIVLALIATYFTDKMYKKKIATGWINKLKYHKDKYSFSAVWIVVLPFFMFFAIPIIYSLIMGTAQIA